MNTMRLFDFPEEILARHREMEELQSVLEDAEIELDEAMESRYEELVQEIIDLELAETGKLDGYGFRIASLKEEAEAAAARKKAVDALVKKHRARERRYQGEADRMSERLHAYMHLTRQGEIKGEHFDFSLARKGGGRSIEVTAKDVNDVPSEFHKTVIDEDAIGRHVSNILSGIDARVKEFEKDLKKNKGLDKLDIIERTDAFRASLEDKELPEYVHVPMKDTRLSIR